jgi:hypothetical protein
MAQPGERKSLMYFVNTTFNYPTMARVYPVAPLNGVNRLYKRLSGTRPHAPAGFPGHIEAHGRWNDSAKLGGCGRPEDATTERQVLQYQIAHVPLERAVQPLLLSNGF